MSQNKFRSEKYIEQRHGKNGWSFRVKYNGHSKTFSEKDYADPRVAYKEAVRYRNEISDLQIFTPYKKTIYDVMEESFDLLVVRQKTRENLKSLFNNHIVDKVNLHDFNEDFAYSKLNAMIETCSNDTISRVYNLFKRIDRTCLIKKYYDRSVMMSVVCPKSHKIAEKRVIKEPVSRADLDKMIASIGFVKSEHERIQFPLILEFIYLTGCRPCEVWPLTWNDISDDNISINKEVGSSIEDTEAIRQSKTDLSNRLLPITPKMKKLLKQAKKASGESPLVFPNKDGRMYSTDLIGARFKDIAKKAGVDFHLYSLRNRFATDLTLNHVDDRTKMELMGHKNIRMTLHYARSDQKTKKKALSDR